MADVRPQAIRHVIGRTVTEVRARLEDAPALAALVREALRRVLDEGVLDEGAGVRSNRPANDVP